MEQNGGNARTGLRLRPGIAFSSWNLTFICLGYLTALGMAEYLSHSISPTAGIVLYLFILFGLIAIAAFSREKPFQGFWMAMGLAPFIRMISLATPVMLTISQYIWYIVISIPIITALVTAARFNKFSLEEIGLRLNRPLGQFLIALSGIALAGIAYLALRPAAWTTELTIQSTLFPSLVLLLFTGLLEELAFRGVMQRAAGALGSIGWIYVAAVYAVLQIQQGSILYCLVAIAAGLYFGYMVKRTGSILGVGLAHGLLNIGLYLILPHLVKI